MLAKQWPLDMTDHAWPPTMGSHAGPTLADNGPPCLAMLAELLADHGPSLVGPWPAMAGQTTLPQVTDRGPTMADHGRP